jgi:hypothetical protein
MWKYQDRGDREGLNRYNGSCAEVFDFFVPANSYGSLFLLMIFYLQWLLYLHFLGGIKEQWESVDQNDFKNAKL